MPAIADRSKTSSPPNVGRRSRMERMGSWIVILVLAAVVAVNAGELYRRVSFWTTGSAPVDGLTFFLNPDDECLTYYILENGTWEEAETRLVLDRLSPGYTVLDVGANVGWYTVLASKAVGESGQVIAFEPDPTNFALLKRNVEANGCTNVRLEQLALSNEPGSITLHLHDRNKGMHSVLGSGEADESVEVAAVRLDDYLADSSRRIDFAKIDVEGAEGLVLDGMPETLRANPQMDLLLEFAPARLSATGYDGQALLEELGAGGFRILEIDLADGSTRPAVASELIQRISGQTKPYANLLLEGTAPVHEK